MIVVFLLIYCSDTSLTHWAVVSVSFDGEAVISALCFKRFLWKLMLGRGEKNE